MSRSPKIPKELILQTSLNLLIKDGYSSVTIKNVAKELQCSTQPISWHFGSMNGFRASLTEYALQYVQENYPIQTTNPFSSFYSTGMAHLDLAINAPHLFHFLYMGENGMLLSNNIFHTINSPNTSYSILKIADYLGISTTQANEFVNTMVFYTHGLSVMVVNHTMEKSAEVLHQMLTNTSYNLLISYGIPPETALSSLNLNG